MDGCSRAFKNQGGESFDHKLLICRISMIISVVVLACADGSGGVKGKAAANPVVKTKHDGDQVTVACYDGGSGDD